MSYIYIGQYYDKEGYELELPYRKIGKSIDVPQRENALNNTKGPIGYMMVAIWRVGDDYTKIEQALHAILDNTRVEGEWFVDGDNTLLIRLACFMKKMDFEAVPIVALDDDEQKELDAVRELIRPRINFFYLGLKVGDTIVFKRNPLITATIASSNEVAYNNNLYALTTLTKLVKNDKRPVSGAIEWRFEDELLTDRRNRMEQAGTYGEQSND